MLDIRFRDTYIYCLYTKYSCDPPYTTSTLLGNYFGLEYDLIWKLIIYFGAVGLFFFLKNNRRIQECDIL